MPAGEPCGAGILPAGEPCGAGFQPAGEKNTITAKDIARIDEPPLALGNCILRQPEAAKIVQDALLFFEGDRYSLAAWCIMPNHVHVVVAPFCGYELSAILHSWKSFTANRINDIAGGAGAVWERESFDHLIRSADDIEQFVKYTEENPVTAGLCDLPQEWPHSSCGAGFQPANPGFYVDPRETPYVPMTSRGELPHLHKEGGFYFVTFRLADAVEYKTDHGNAGRMPAPQNGSH